MASTYTPIATYTVPSAAADYTFTSISSSYTDLILVINATPNSGGMNFLIQTGNGSIDSGSNYSQTFLSGTGSVANSNRTSNATFLQSYINAATTGIATVIVNFQNYSNTTTYKTVLQRANGSGETTASVGLWRSTSAINQIKLTGQTNNFAAGSTFTLYGIKAA